jgi:small neutral amino acid transporter SnatA (MarC family)
MGESLISTTSNYKFYHLPGFFIKYQKKLTILNIRWHQIVSELEDKVKEQIKFNTEIFKLLAVLFLADTGGLIGLILKGDQTAKENLFIAGGLILGAISIRLMYIRYKTTQKLIDNEF